MQLNPACIKDILLTVEKYCSYRNYLVFGIGANYSDTLLNKYQPDEIMYHVYQCQSSGLLLKTTEYMNGLEVEGLSPEGHKFLANIKNEKILSKAKGLLINAGTQVSIEALKLVFAQIIGN